MTDFSDHVKILTLALVPLLGLFIIAYTFHADALWKGTAGAIGVVILVVLILARFGGGPDTTG